MKTELKTRLDSARAALASLAQQGATANDNRTAILSRRTEAEHNLNVARASLERLELAHLRGLIAADQVQAARGGVADCERALQRQIADEEIAVRACDLSSESAHAQAEFVAARTVYFDGIADRIAANVRADAKLRKQLMAAWSAAAASQGRAQGDFGRVNWLGVLEAVFPEPTAAEMQQAFAGFMAEHDAGQ